MLTGLAGILPGILVIKGGKLVSQHLLHMMLSLIIGVVIGEWLGIEALIERFSNRIETVVKNAGKTEVSPPLPRASLEQRSYFARARWRS